MDSRTLAKMSGMSRTFPAVTDSGHPPDHQTQCNFCKPCFSCDSRKSYPMRAVSSIEVIFDVPAEATWGIIVLDRHSCASSWRNSGKTSCRKMPCMWPVNRVGRMYGPAMLLYTISGETLIESFSW